MTSDCNNSRKFRERRAIIIKGKGFGWTQLGQIAHECVAIVHRLNVKIRLPEPCSNLLEALRRVEADGIGRPTRFRGIVRQDTSETAISARQPPQAHPRGGKIGDEANGDYSGVWTRRVNCSASLRWVSSLNKNARVMMRPSSSGRTNSSPDQKRQPSHVLNP